MTEQEPHVYERRVRPASWLDRGNTFRVRFAARASALLFLGAVIVTGLVRGDYFNYENSPWLMLPGKAAGVVGMAAEDITIAGLQHHDPEVLLAAIGVAPGGSLIGFDATMARRILENLDWIETAKVQRRFPNQLEIAIKEREPFAIWQRGGAYYVIDKTGAAMSGLPAAQLVRLPLLSGEGANVAAADLVNQLSAYPDLLLQVKAAARVGDRRWTLYLDNGITVQLPEKGWQDAIRMTDELNRTQHLLSRGIRSVDLRLDGRVIVEVAEIQAEEPGNGKKKKVAGQN
jgi:cell division protein FtsQ